MNNISDKNNKTNQSDPTHQTAHESTISMKSHSDIKLSSVGENFINKQMFNNDVCSIVSQKKQLEKTQIKLERKFLLILFATFLINLVTIIFSIMSDSISMISDALHGFFDVLLMLGCYISINISRKQTKNEYSFGYHRLETMVSVCLNIIFICLLFMCIIQSLIRINLKLFNPSEYSSEIDLNKQYMITSSVISIIGDIIILYLMKTRKEIKNLYNEFSRCC
jgi:Co/Zn/Cd efflux system component